MTRRAKIMVGSSLMIVGAVLAHVAVWLSSVPRNQYDTLWKIILADAVGLAFVGYLVASYGLIVDEPDARGAAS